MSGLRLLLVTPRFWPLCGDTERAVAGLADEARRQGARVSVLTAAWGADWPSQYVLRETPVVRLPAAPLGGWRTLRYLRTLARWLRERRSEFDAVYVANLRFDAYTVIRSLHATAAAIVLRADDGDLVWQQRSQLGRRVRRTCTTAAAIVAATHGDARRLIDDGYPAGHVHVIPQGVRVSPPRTARDRLQARQALASINHDLTAPEYAPVAVWAGRLDDAAGLPELIAAWGGVVDRWPSARLWLIGDGPERQPLCDLIVARGRHHDTFMPGSFDELREVFLAADIYVAPRQQFGASISQLEALACGLPLVAADTPDNRDIMGNSQAGSLVPAGNPTAWAAAICRLFETPDEARSGSVAAQQLAQQKFSLERTTALQLRLIEQFRESPLRRHR